MIGKVHNGYVRQPKLICLIKVEYEDGTSKNIISDLTWKITGSPIVYDGPRINNDNTQNEVRVVFYGRDFSFYIYFVQCTSKD